MISNELFEKLVYREKQEEGFSPKVYRCPRGKLTIGYGHNCEDNIISESLAELILREDLLKVIAGLNRLIPDFDRLPAKVQEVLIDMAFQMGVGGLKTFKKMLSAIGRKDWKTAARELMDSKYAQECPNRAARNAVILQEAKY